MKHIILGISDDGVGSIGGKEFQRGASIAGIDFGNLDFNQLATFIDCHVVQLTPIDDSQLIPIGYDTGRGFARSPKISSQYEGPRKFDVGARAVFWAIDNKSKIDQLLANVEFKSVVKMCDENIDLYIQSKKYDRIETASELDLDKLDLPKYALDFIERNYLTVHTYYSNGCMLASSSKVNNKFLIHPDYDTMTLLPCPIYLYKTRILAISDKQFVSIDTNEPIISESVYIPENHTIIPEWFCRNGMIISVNFTLGSGDTKYAIAGPNSPGVYASDFEFKGDLLFAHTPYHHAMHQCDISIYNWKDNPSVNIVPASMRPSTHDYIILNDKYFLLKLSTSDTNRDMYELFNSNGCVTAKSISEYFITEHEKETYLFTKSACTGNHYVFNLTGEFKCNRLADVVKLEKYSHGYLVCYIATCQDSSKYIMDTRGQAISSRYKSITPVDMYAVVDKENGTSNVVDLLHPAVEIIFEDYLYVSIINGSYMRYGDIYDTIRELKTGKIIIDESQQYRFEGALYHNYLAYFRLLDSTDALVAVPAHSPNDIAHLFINIDVLDYLDIQYVYIDRPICMFGEEVVELNNVENYVNDKITCTELEKAVILREIYKLSELDEVKLQEYTKLIAILKTK
jgi:hypothetical protein